MERWLICLISSHILVTSWILVINFESLGAKGGQYFLNIYNWFEIINTGTHISIIVQLILELQTSHLVADEYEQDTKRIRILMVFTVIFGFMKQT